MLPSVPGVCDHKLAVLDTQAHFSAGTKANPLSQARGIRTPKLFIHFWTRVCMATKWTYAEYAGFGLQPHRPHFSNALKLYPAYS